MRVLFSALLFSFLYGCADSSAEVATEVSGPELAGRWELTEARRDNVKTNLLEGLYFEFGEEEVFATNLLTGEDQRGKYYREGAEIVTEGVAVPMTYEIEEMEDGRLLLRSRYEGYVFSFELAKAGEGHGH